MMQSLEPSFKSLFDCDCDGIRIARESRSLHLTAFFIVIMMECAKREKVI